MWIMVFLVALEQVGATRIVRLGSLLKYFVLPKSVDISG
jgi:hypothetical protein